MHRSTQSGFKSVSGSNCPVASRLKQARIQHGISQRNLGIAAGIEASSSSARMNQYERGKHVPDYDTLVKLAAVLNVPVGYFYCADDDDANFMLNYHQLREQQQNHVRTLLERINFDA